MNKRKKARKALVLSLCFILFFCVNLITLAPVSAQAAGLSLDAAEQQLESVSEASSEADYPYLGYQRVLVVLVDFNNCQIQYESSWYTRLFSPYEASNSMKMYYNEVSNGKISIVPAMETYGTANDGIVRVRLNMNHPNIGESYFLDDDVVTQAMIKTSPYVSLSQYDTNSNGKIENSELHIVFVLAGYSHADSPTPNVRPHYSSFESVTIQNKALSYYSMIGEKFSNGSMLNIGTFCHELAHSMGCPDLYRDVTPNDYFFDVDDFSLMSYGGHNGNPSGSSPAHLDPYCKIKLGIVEPTVISLGSSGYYSVKAFDQTGYNILKITTSDPNQYFLIENRQYIGFDAAIKYNSNRNGTGGILVWQVQQAPALKVRLIQCETFDEPYYAGVNYLNVAHGSSLSSTTTPSTLMFNGRYPSFSMTCMTAAASNMTIYLSNPIIPVTNVSMKASTSLMVGGSETLVPTFTPVNATYQNISWSSSNKSVATVNENGVVTGRSPGTAVITATTAVEGKTASCTVTVDYMDIAVTSVSPQSSLIHDGDTVTFRAVIRNVSSVPFNGDFPINLHLYIDGQSRDAASLYSCSLQPGGMKVVTFTYQWTASFGLHTVKVIANPPFAYDETQHPFIESDYDNNLLQTRFSVEDA